MIDTSAIDDLEKEFTDRINLLLKRMLQEGNKMVPDTKTDIYLEFADHQQKMITNIFVDAVQDFYASYDPIYYNRTWSLYNALVLNPNDEYGRFGVQLTASELYDPSGVTPFRNGDSEGLFDLTIRYGWHGGAAGTDKNGMSVSSPHYRWPYADDGPRFYKWGREAVQSEPPMSVVERNYASEIPNLREELRAIATHHCGKLAQRWQAKTNELVAEMFGDWG